MKTETVSCDLCSAPITKDWLRLKMEIGNSDTTEVTMDVCRECQLTKSLKDIAHQISARNYYRRIEEGWPV